MNALRNGDPRLLGPALSNDLEPAALDLQPRLRTVLETGLEYGALGALVSGRVPPVPSWWMVRLLRSTSPCRSVQRGCAGRSGVRQVR